MKPNNRLVKTKDSASTSDRKEIILAKISTKQAIIVAIIGLFSAVAVAAITNLDKIGTLKSSNEEIGYYEGRASFVEGAFNKTEEQIDLQSEQARQLGDFETANHLKDIANMVRRERTKFQERHKKHIGAIQSGKRLDASKIKTETNEGILGVDLKLLEIYKLPESDKRRATITAMLRDLKPGDIIYLSGHGTLAIPLYGKQRVDVQEQLCDD
ncbi:MAG TPA: hypothetical protein VFQ47_02510 [Nitrososphaera sp.]|jgi:hypothetical protein|nr:hypothetical protein [Nitrososphaera sp.]